MERSEAINLGLKIYNTGRPCKHGHNSDRYTDSGACKLCLRKIVAAKVVRDADIDAKTSRIFLFSQESGFDALAVVIDDLVTKHCPELPLRQVNPLPLSGVRVSNKTYQIKVRVPVGCEDEMRAIGELLRESEYVAS